MEQDKPQDAQANLVGTQTNPSPEHEPAWLSGRLQRAEEAATRRLLETLGVADVKDAKRALDSYKNTVESQKSEFEKAAEKIAKLQPLETQVQELRASIERHAKSAFESLTPEQREAVIDLAGDDPARQLDTITKLQARGLIRTAPTQSQAHTTANGTNAPAPATVSTPNHLATWRQLQTQNPMAAATYRVRHNAEISKALAAEKS